MGLLNLLFGQKPPPEAPAERIPQSIATMQQYLRSIMSHYGEEHFQGDSQAKEILAVYSFGGISALAMQHQMSPPQAHAVCLALFTKLFGFDAADAAAKAEAVITAAPDRTSHLYGVIRRGADGFVHWQQQSGDGAAKDFAEIMAHFQKAKT
jgi:Immunity protein 48